MSLRNKYFGCIIAEPELISMEETLKWPLTLLLQKNPGLGGVTNATVQNLQTRKFVSWLTYLLPVFCSPIFLLMGPDNGYYGSRIG